VPRSCRRILGTRSERVVFGAVLADFCFAVHGGVEAAFGVEVASAEGVRFGDDDRSPSPFIRVSRRWSAPARNVTVALLRVVTSEAAMSLASSWVSTARRRMFVRLLVPAGNVVILRCPAPRCALLASNPNVLAVRVLKRVGVEKHVIERRVKDGVLFVAAPST